ncbi:hypothetical protein ACHAWC_000756 [Mediolabrus comicus]
MVDTKRFIFVGDGPYKGKSSGERKSSCTGQRLVKRLLKRANQRLQEQWDKRFGQLVEYHRVNGHCNVPRSYEPNPQLGEWVNTQRQFVKTKKLAADRVAKLEQLGFRWNVRVDKWDVRFGELVEYHRVNGHCNVPRSYEPNPQLGEWVNTQRQFVKTKKLAADRVAKLEQLGFRWNVRVDKWDVRFGELVEYHRVNGHCNVPKRYEPNRQLGSWVNTQRAYRRKGKLAADRVAKLEELGFQWSAAL